MRRIETDLVGIAWLLAAQMDLRHLAQTNLLAPILQEARTFLSERVFLHLSFLYDLDAIMDIWRTVNQKSRKQRVHAEELLVVVLDHEIRRFIAPLVVDLPWNEQYHRLNAFFPQPPLSVEERLRSILTDTNGWASPLLNASAVYVAGWLRLQSLATTIAPLLESDDRLMHETALWALRAINGVRAHRTLEAAQGGGIGVASQSERENTGKKDMLLLIEKMLALKSVPMFAALPDYVLSRLATLLREVHLDAGHLLFDQGEESTALYIVYQGAIDISFKGMEIQTLGENEAFGELALFDDAPRAARATAGKDSVLLRLDKEVFADLIADHPQILHGITSVLLKRMRDFVAHRF